MNVRLISTLQLFACYVLFQLLEWILRLRQTLLFHVNAHPPPQGLVIIHRPLYFQTKVQNFYTLYFQAGEDELLLLREVVAVEHPFVRGSTSWEDIATTLQTELPTKFSKLVLLRELYESEQQI